MKMKKKIIIQILLLFFFAIFTPHIVSAEVMTEAFTTGTSASEVISEVGISGVTGGSLMYTSSLSSRVLPENPFVPFEIHYSVDIASVDREHPVSAIVSTLFAAKSVSVMANNSSAQASTDIEDRTKVAGQIQRILKEFDYTYNLIS